jgi:putative phosphoesterase
MKVGILSDSHGNLAALMKAVKLFNDLQVGAVVHCGDWDAPFMMMALSRFKGRVIGILGNCDGEKKGMRRLAKTLGWEFSVPPHETEIDRRRFLLLHEPDQLEERAWSSRYDVILHGHAHALPESRDGGERIEKVGSTLVINPGEAGGWIHGRATVALLDTGTLEGEIVELMRTEVFERGLS